jgi:hypothetical protein
VLHENRFSQFPFTVKPSKEILKSCLSKINPRLLRCENYHVARVMILGNTFPIAVIHQPIHSGFADFNIFCIITVVREVTRFLLLLLRLYITGDLFGRWQLEETILATSITV